MNERQRLHSPGKFVFERAPGANAVTTDTGGPACFVVDREQGVRRLIVSVSEELGLRAVEFDDVPPMLEAAAQRRPDLVFLDIGSDGARTMSMLGTAAISCPVQIMSGYNAVLLEELRRSGERRGLRMLPVLHKPFRHNAVKRIVHDLGLRRDALSNLNVTLLQALGHGWLDVWYQPKIDLRAKLLAGAEAYVRVRHPVHGIMPPDSVLADAGERELLMLTEFVIKTVLRDWSAFAEFGIPLKFAVNVPVVALSELSLSSILRQERPRQANWPGMVLEITEDEILPEISLARHIVKELRAYNVGLAVDDFGAGYAVLARLKDVPFCELKIDRSYVGNCDVDQTNAGLCETVIDLAHRFGILALAEGIETTAELKALHRMNCDLGQGYLFARPLPKEQFADLLRLRGKSRATR
jgi:EAL domain-containing protein (putative c-di-GMP-specific phosphodiesterase class I)